MPLRTQVLELATSLIVLCGTASNSVAQTAPNQPPANYRGPDTYGMCTYVIGDTTYYGNTFYTSSYFKVKAEQAMREYAVSQAKGTPVHSRCVWSFKESDLAVMKETDRRLLGLPGHSAQGVETGWTFTGGTPLNGSPSTVGASGVPATGASAQGSNGVSLSGVAGTALPANGVSGTSLPAPAATSPNSLASGRSSTSPGTLGTLAGGSRQAVTNAKTNAVSSAAGGMTGATNTTLGTLGDRVGNAFHRKSAQPTAQAQTAMPTAAGAEAGAQANSLPASPLGGSLGMDEGAAAVAAAASAGPPAPTAATVNPSATAIEGLIADVSGKDIIINVGQQAGVRAGTTLAVLHPRVVKDPATGKPLRTVESQVGELQILSVEALSANGVYRGTGVPVVGDKVRPKP